MRKHTFRVPKSLVLNVNLDYTTRRLGVIMYSRRNPLGHCKKSLQQWADLSGLSVPTVRKALKQLKTAGYVIEKKVYTYSKNLGRKVYGTTEYQLNISWRGGFCMISRDALAYEISDSAFAIYCYLALRAGGKEQRAWPSLRNIAEKVGTALSTVCEAVKALKQCCGILIENCLKKNGAYSCNSYFVNLTFLTTQLYNADNIPQSSLMAFQRIEKKTCKKDHLLESIGKWVCAKGKCVWDFCRTVGYGAMYSLWQ